VVNIITGINSFQEAVELIDISDEFYFGLRFISNHREYFENLNLEYIDTAFKIIDFVRKKNKRIYFVANEIYRLDELKKVYEVIEKLVRRGLNGVIIRDINLGFRIRKLTDIILSSTALVFNSGTLEFYKNIFPLRRVIIPQHLSLKDARNLILKNKDVEFEIFYLPEIYCSNVDGICLFHIFDETKNKMGCFYAFFINNKNFKPFKPSFNLRIKIIKEWIKMGISSIKIPRDYTTSKKIEVITKIKREYIND